MSAVTPKYRNPTAHEQAIVHRALEIGAPRTVGDFVLGPTDPNEKVRLIDRLTKAFAESEVTYVCSCCRTLDVHEADGKTDWTALADVYGRCATGPMMVIIFANDSMIGGVEIVPVVSDEYEVDLPTVESLRATSEEVDLTWTVPPGKWKRVWGESSELLR
jgi:hypothetical protein